MLHSRPGFAPRSNDTVPAKLNDDMIPALNRRDKEASHAKGLDVKLPELTPAQLETAVALHHARALAAKSIPEIIANPAPSAAPVLTSPHKE